MAAARISHICSQYPHKPVWNAAERYSRSHDRESMPVLAYLWQHGFPEARRFLDGVHVTHAFPGWLSLSVPARKDHEPPRKHLTKSEHMSAPTAFPPLR